MEMAFRENNSTTIGASLGGLLTGQPAPGIFTEVGKKKKGE